MMAATPPKDSSPSARLSDTDRTYLRLWLENQLRAERANLLRDMEQRHQNLLAEMGNIQVFPRTLDDSSAVGREASSWSANFLGIHPLLPNSSTKEAGALEAHPIPVEETLANEAERCGDGDFTPVQPPTTVRTSGERRSASSEDQRQRPGSRSLTLSSVEDAAATPTPSTRQESDAQRRESNGTDAAGSDRVYKNKALRAVSHSRQTGGSWVSRFVNGPWFEVASAVLIVSNTVSMAFEAEYKGMESGFKLRAPDFDRPADDEWPGAEEAFNLTNIFFLTAFIVELLFRYWAWRLRALQNPWVLLDTVIVSGSLIEELGLWPFDTSTLRLVRLLRIVRVLRVARAIHAFDTLFLLVKSLIASLSALFWSFVVLLLLQLAVGMLLSQILHEYIEDDSKPIEIRQEVFYYFGTFAKMVLTMFEITFANWVPSCRFFVDNVSGHFTLFYIVYRNMICFAVIRVIAAIFICETNRIAAADDDLQIRSQTRTRAQFFKKLQDVFQELDTSGDGTLDMKEFERLLTDDLLKVWLRTLEVEAADLRETFKALDDGDGKITIDDFVEGVLRCRGNARAVDVISVKTRLGKVEARLKDTHATLACLAAPQSWATSPQGRKALTTPRSLPPVESAASFEI